MEKMLRVFEISRMTNHNGPGIRTLVHFKGCPLRCQWCSTPESQISKMELLQKKAKCIGCGACIESCEYHAIIPSDSGIPEIDRRRCRECFRCTENCYAKSLVKCGRDWDAEELFREIMKDEMFFRMSNGGITFSGGEPLMMVDDEMKRLYQRISARGISIGVDTTGCVPWENIEKIFPYVDFFLWDLKIMNAEKHKEYTGVDNQLILDNLKKVDALAEVYHKDVYIRCVQIPQITDSEQNLRDTVQFVKTLKRVKSLDLINYHQYGLKRYQALGREYPLNGAEPLADTVLKGKQRLVRENGVPCRILS